MLSQTNALVTGQELRQPRLNMAGVCQWCDERGCLRRECIERYELAVWAVCPDCNGHGYSPLDWLKLCTWCSATGVAQVGSLPAGGRLSVEPVSVPPALLTVALPRCLTCGQRTATAHGGCRVPTAMWQPCQACAGLRIDADGFECQDCCGVGFIEMDATTTLAERAQDELPYLTVDENVLDALAQLPRLTYP